MAQTIRRNAKPVRRQARAQSARTKARKARQLVIEQHAIRPLAANHFEADRRVGRTDHGVFRRQ